jgi:hypothetical protein
MSAATWGAIPDFTSLIRATRLSALRRYWPLYRIMAAAISAAMAAIAPR